MKKLLVACAVLVLCSFQAFCQEAEVSVAARAEAYGCMSDEQFETDLGASSLYTFFDGSISEQLSFSISTHWLSSSPGDLYTGLLDGNDCDWLDWGYLDFCPGSWGLTAGKLFHYIGLFSQDDYDVDVYWPVAPKSWNDYNVYQWGASAYICPWEGHTVEFQVVNSNFAGKRFSKVPTFGVNWRGEMGSFETIWAANFMGFENQDGKNSYEKTLGLGNRYHAGDLQLTADLFFHLDSFSEFTLSADYEFSEKFNAGLWSSFCTGDAAFSMAGFKAEWLPLENLRFHIAGSWCSDVWNRFQVCAGATYFLNFTIGK